MAPVETPDPAPRPPSGDDWLAVSAAELPLAEATRWAVLPSCGALVSFSGMSRDHSGAAGTQDERVGVTTLEYEAYDHHVVARLTAVATEVRRRWPTIGRVALWHRTGSVAVTETSVIVVVSAPHRAEAFAAARFAIDAVKATVPIWKREVWPGGSAWGVDAHPVEDLRSFAVGSAGDGDVAVPSPS